MRVLNCEKGHRWEIPDNQSSDGDESGTACPVCGAEGLATHDESLDVTAEMVLPRGDTMPSLLPDATLLSPGCDAADESPDADAGEFSGNVRYVVLRPHARGGLGKVSVARDEAFQRIVAVKEIREDAVSADSRERFLREAEITGQLEHPGIVPVHSLGTDDQGRPYYAMKFIEGQTLGDAIDAYREHPTRLAFRDLLSRFVVVCQTIAYTHGRGVIHRDLKPSNIMLGEYGETLVVDWGLAKRLDAPESDDWRRQDSDIAPTLDADLDELTMQGHVLGTPNYMAPEQARGETAQIGPAADVYSLGAVLYKLLTGRAPAIGKKLDVLEQVQEGRWPRPTEIDRGVPKALEAVCLKAMALAIEDRYASAEQLAEEIERWLSDEPPLEYREPPIARAGRWMRRHRPLVVGIAVLLIGSVVALVTSNILVNREQTRTEQARLLAEKRSGELEQRTGQLEQRTGELEQTGVKLTASLDQSERLREEAVEQTVRANALVKDLEAEREKLVLENYVSTVAAAQGKIHEGAIGPAVELLERAPKKHRGWEWGRLMQLCNLDALTMKTTSLGHNAGFTLSGDQRYFMGWHGGEALVFDFRTGKLVGEFKKLDGGASLSPQSDLLYVGAGEMVLGKNILTGKIEFEFSPPSKVSSLGVDHAGERLLVGGYDGKLRIVQLKNKKIVQTILFNEKGGGCHHCTFCRDGKSILALHGANAIVWDAATGKEKLRVPDCGQGISSASISADGSRLLTGHRYAEVKLWDIASGKVLRSYKVSDSARAVALSPDGTRALAGGYFGLRHWDFDDPQNDRQLKGHRAVVHSLVFSPDGHWAVSYAPPGEIKIWDMQDRRDLTVLVPPPAIDVHREAPIAVTPDGTFLLAGGWRDKATLWNLKTGKKLLTLPGAGPMQRSAAISPDGKWGLIGSTAPSPALWDLRSGERKGIGGMRDVMAIAVNADSNRALYGGKSPNVYYIEIPSGKNLATLKPNVGGISAVAFGRDGWLALLRGTKGVVSWELGVNRLHASLDLTGQPHFPAAILSDGRRALIPGHEVLKVWDIQSGKVLKTLKTGAWVAAMAVSPDDRRVMLGYFDQTIRVWDIEHEREMFAFRATGGGLSAMAMADDGRRLVSGTWGGARRIVLYPALDWTKESSHFAQQKRQRWIELHKSPR